MNVLWNLKACRTLLRTSVEHGEGTISSLDGIGQRTALQNSGGAKMFEIDGEPLFETKSLHDMIQLFHIAQMRSSFVLESRFVVHCWICSSWTFINHSVGFNSNDATILST
ncbi:uncharacterized protein LOC131623461 [Vicia villosa]|uniref:uncharacterized protein LOC131623461 n=1 Tax=Vicia villosa TaxID=3911 RepID=UPI00273AFC08|nr:uncharacterized protein LOC131623461 [Vicia villosa]